MLSFEKVHHYYFPISTSDYELLAEIIEWINENILRGRTETFLSQKDRAIQKIAVPRYGLIAAIIYFAWRRLPKIQTKYFEAFRDSYLILKIFQIKLYWKSVAVEYCNWILHQTFYFLLRKLLGLFQHWVDLLFIWTLVWSYLFVFVAFRWVFAKGIWACGHER